MARGSAALAATAREIAAATGVAVTPVAADVTTPQGRAAVIAACPAPDILVNNAEGRLPGDFRNWTRDDWIDALDTMMLCHIEMMRLTVDGMMARGFGRIVNIKVAQLKIPARAGPPQRRPLRSSDLPPASPARRWRTTSPSTICCRGFRQQRPARARRGDGRGQQVVTTSRTNCGAPRPGATQPDASAGPEELGDYCAFLCSANAGFYNRQNLVIDGGSYPGRIRAQPLLSSRKAVRKRGGVGWGLVNTRRVEKTHSQPSPKTGREIEREEVTSETPSGHAARARAPARRPAAAQDLSEPNREHRGALPAGGSVDGASPASSRRSSLKVSVSPSSSRTGRRRRRHRRRSGGQGSAGRLHADADGIDPRDHAVSGEGHAL